MKNIRRLIAATTLTTLLAVGSTFAQPHGNGHGHGRAGHGGPSGDFHGVIHSLFANHDKVERSVELTENGYRAKTISKDKKVARSLKTHVEQMESRLDKGMGVRHWDPAYAELREHYADISFKITNLKDGISVNVIGKTPEAVKVAQNHAKIISEFVTEGEEQMHKQHKRALDGGETDTALQTKSEKCENCKSGNSASECKAGEPCGQAKKTCCADAGS